MGNSVTVKYKARRGANAAGSEVTNAKDWWTQVCHEDFDRVKEAFDNDYPKR